MLSRKAMEDTSTECKLSVAFLFFSKNVASAIYMTKRLQDG